MNLKNIVSKNVFLYKIWFYLILKRKNKKLFLPESHNPLYFDGYPRSGNTYTFALIYRVFPKLEQKVAHHLHAIAGLKMALNNGTKSLVIIRHPKDAIISYLFVKKTLFNKKPEVLDELIIQYIHYYNFVSKNIKKIKIINFDIFIKNEKDSLKEIGEWIGINPTINMEKLIFDNKIRMKNFQKMQDPKYSSLPNVERQKFKERNIESISSSKYYHEALQIYEYLTKNIN